jgi:predicted transglutaminase-like cysteine proteinase
MKTIIIFLLLTTKSIASIDLNSFKIPAMPPKGYLSTKITNNTSNELIPYNDLLYLLNQIDIKAKPEHKTDIWTERADDISYGDCEDFALTIRRLIIQQGYNGGHLVLSEPDNRKHITLYIPTDIGNYFIDLKQIKEQIDNVKKVEVNNKWYSKKFIIG